MTGGDEHGPGVRGWLAAAAIRTVSNLEASAGDANFEVGKGVEGGEDLHGADSVQHVGVVARGGAKAAVGVEA